jgi:hypothetical protein
MPPPLTSIGRPPQDIVSAPDSCRHKFSSTSLPLNRSSISGPGVLERPHQQASAVSRFPVPIPLPPGTPRRRPSHMEHQTQNWAPRPPAQFMRPSTRPMPRMGFRTGSMTGNTNYTIQDLNSTGRGAPGVAELDGPLKAGPWVAQGFDNKS